LALERVSVIGVNATVNYRLKHPHGGSSPTESKPGFLPKGFSSIIYLSVIFPGWTPTTPTAHILFVLHHYTCRGHGVFIFQFGPFRMWIKFLKCPIPDESTLYSFRMGATALEVSLRESEAFGIAWFSRNKYGCNSLDINVIKFPGCKIWVSDSGGILAKWHLKSYSITSVYGKDI